MKTITKIVTTIYVFTDEDEHKNSVKTKQLKYPVSSATESENYMIGSITINTDFLFFVTNEK